MKIKLEFSSTLLLLTFILSDPLFALGTILAVFFHESGHIIAANVSNVRFNEMKIGIFGARLNTKSNIVSYKKEIFICMMGPLSNFILSTALLPVYSISNDRLLLYFIVSSFFLGGLNLLPVSSFDGGRILHALFCLISEQNLADKIMSVLSFIVIFCIWSFSLYLLLISQSGLSLYVFSISLFSEFFIK